MTYRLKNPHPCFVWGSFSSEYYLISHLLEVYSFTYAYTNNLSWKGTSRGHLVQSPIQSRACLDQDFQLSAPCQVFIWIRTSTGELKGLTATQCKEENKARYVHVVWLFYGFFVWYKTYASGKYYKFLAYNDNKIGKSLRAFCSCFEKWWLFSMSCLKLINYSLFLHSLKYCSPHPGASRKGRVGTGPENGLGAEFQHQDISLLSLAHAW